MIGSPCRYPRYVGGSPAAAAFRLAATWPRRARHAPEGGDATPCPRRDDVCPQRQAAGNSTDKYRRTRLSPRQRNGPGARHSACSIR